MNVTVRWLGYNLLRSSGRDKYLLMRACIVAVIYTGYSFDHSIGVAMGCLNSYDWCLLVHRSSKRSGGCWGEGVSRAEVHLIIFACVNVNMGPLCQ